MPKAAPTKPRIEITVDEHGIEGVKLYASSPEGEDVALMLFQRLRPLLRQVPGFLALSVDADRGSKPC